jgi:hypothetical protein
MPGKEPAKGRGNVVPVSSSACGSFHSYQSLHGYFLRQAPGGTVRTEADWEGMEEKLCIIYSISAL